MVKLIQYFNDGKSRFMVWTEKGKDWFFWWNEPTFEKMVRDGYNHYEHYDRCLKN